MTYIVCGTLSLTQSINHVSLKASSLQSVGVHCVLSIYRFLSAVLSRHLTVDFTAHKCEDHCDVL